MLIIINEVPLSKNKYVNMHWAKRAKYKEDISWVIFEQKMFNEEANPEEHKGMPYKKAKINIDIFFKDNKKRDVANYLGGGLISWLDCLVDLGFIADDNYSVIGQPMVSFYTDKEFPRTEIKIEEVK